MEDRLRVMSVTEEVTTSDDHALNDASLLFESEFAAGNWAWPPI